MPYSQTGHQIHCHPNPALHFYSAVSIKQKAERPLGDLFLTLLHQFDVPAKSFADNAGEFREILAS